MVRIYEKVEQKKDKTQGDCKKTETIDNLKLR